MADLAAGGINKPIAFGGSENVLIEFDGCGASLTAIVGQKAG